MKIVRVNSRFTPPGGVVANIVETGRRMRAAGDDVVVYASNVDVSSAKERRMDYSTEVEGLPVRRFPQRDQLIPPFRWPWLTGLIGALAESGADVIHAHVHRMPHVLEAAAASQRSGIPLVVSLSYHPAHQHEPFLKRSMIRMADLGFGRTAYRVARALIVETRFEAGLVAGFAPPDRIRVIPPGIDLSEWETPETDVARGLPIPDEYFLYTGRIARDKGLEHLIAAIARLSDSERRPLVLMGYDWGDRARLEELARGLGVAGSVIFLGRVADRSAFRAVMRGARALVLPSEWEAYGFVLMDAMAARTPIVASRVGAIPEALDGGAIGLMVPYGDAEGLANALRTVLEDPAGARTRVDRGWEKVRRMDWTETTRRMRALYEEVARA